MSRIEDEVALVTRACSGIAAVIAFLASSDGQGVHGKEYMADLGKTSG